MNAKDFFLLVSSMRKAQKDYFRTRTTEALKQSKSLEKQVDAEIQRVNDIKEKKLRTPVFYAKCPRCGTEFTYEGEDVVSTIESQIEGTAYRVRCPRCNYPFWADREIYTYLLK